FSTPRILLCQLNHLRPRYPGVLKMIFFFFQAEDGIRDFHVTGVQTCALPIWGVDSGPYVMLPFFGPSTVRDGSALAVEGYAGYSYRGQMDHVPSRNTALGVDVVDTRAGLLSQERLIRGDQYSFVRNVWFQNR